MPNDGYHSDSACMLLTYFIVLVLFDVEVVAVVVAVVIVVLGVGIVVGSVLFLRSLLLILSLMLFCSSCFVVVAAAFTKRPGFLPRMLLVFCFSLGSNVLTSNNVDSLFIL